ncbi:FKBP-type peptidyl-prolyl cis-trans isomerase [Amycolatopsis endophytica]|uniref:peptidylprolyl isomerase n=1 Tax=Amycolatopsis endophytica TaxID=860233 RepID=A0A853B794_9PSEU|nr:FKBP-type peptidyl-prolyl cis-trans isomerase [Amycolatopsis endophytica]NYI91168.1 peptidylprolyl isomerase [Amycolatopsis endophytica]
MAVRGAVAAVTAMTAVALLGACSPGQWQPFVPPEPAPPSAGTWVGNGPGAIECTVDDITVAGDVGSEPAVTIPDDCIAPNTVLTKDLVPGAGPAAGTGSTMGVNYVLLTWSDKVRMEDSFRTPQLVQVEVGRFGGMPGFREGLPGMRQGGRRLLVLPQDVAAKAGGTVDTLVYVVDAARVGV